jgi:hypothetical protein
MRRMMIVDKWRTSNVPCAGGPVQLVALLPLAYRIAWTNPRV